MRPTISNATVVLSALLSSSCCVIQLILNLFSVSCAGFSVLTPYRAILTTLTITILSYNLYHQQRTSTLNNRKKRSASAVVFVTVLLLISPEITKWINQRDSSRMETNSAMEYVYRVSIRGMGCEACANRIKNKFDSMEWISNTRIFFDNQTAILQSTWPTLNEATIIDTLKSIDAKYDAQVLDFWALTATAATNAK